MAKKKKTPKNDKLENPSEKKKRTTPKKPQVHKDLSGFEISINEFGEIVTNMKMDKLNEFLDKNLDDKKLNEREENKGGPAKDQL